MSVRDAAVLMIIVSDNGAFNMLVDHLGGVDSVNAAFGALGLKITTLKSRVGASSPSPDGRQFAITTASETCSLLEKIAQRDVVSPEGCDHILSFLRRQRHRDKLSRNLPWDELNMLPNPTENWVASKDGVNAFNAVRNDAAIMHGPRGEVAIAAFTEGCGGSNPGPNDAGSILLGMIGELVWKTVCV
jgi:beta-lactamase class A